jgi:CheY-like chemotaxis protein
MEKHTRKSRIASPGRGRDGRWVDPSREEYIRIARALMGSTAEQLAAHVGALPDQRVAPNATPPVQDFERLSAALRTVIKWYNDKLGACPETVDETASGAEALEQLVPRYLAMRSEWESREAQLLASDMNARLQRTTAAMRKADVVADQRAAPSRASRRRALLVDDVSDILVTVGAFLDGIGFDVLRASNGDTALHLLADGARVDLLVTDHAMPGMAGGDLVVEACQRNPGLRALIITGFPDAAALAILPPGVTLLAKPFRRADLIERIQSLFAPGDPILAGKTFARSV